MKQIFYKTHLLFSLKANFLIEKMFMHIKKKLKNAPQALLPLIDQVPEAITSSKMRFMLWLT